MNEYLENYWINKIDIFHTEGGSFWCAQYCNVGKIGWGIL